VMILKLARWVVGFWTSGDFRGQRKKAT